MSRVRFTIVTGASGSGKSTALKTLEDLGFYAVDNLPVALLLPFAQLATGGHAEIARVALGMDVRDRESFHRLPEAVRTLRAEGHPVEVIFLSSSREALQKRFSETRRVHPLDPTLPLAEALDREESLLAPVREEADLLVDTTGMGVHDLRRLLRERYGGEGSGPDLVVTFLSFGFKFGLPKEADLVFDVRFLPNPFFVDGLRELDGRDPAVRRFVEEGPPTGSPAGTTSPRQALEMLGCFLDRLLPLYVAEGRGYLTVAVGCTGGQHRSVAVVEALAEGMRVRDRFRVQVRHRELTAE